jgi:hypothetical protein
MRRIALLLATTMGATASKLMWVGRGAAAVFGLASYWPWCWGWGLWLWLWHPEAP